MKVFVYMFWGYAIPLVAGSHISDRAKVQTADGSLLGC